MLTKYVASTPIQPKPTAKKPTSDEGEITGAQPFTSGKFQNS